MSRPELLSLVEKRDGKEPTFIEKMANAAIKAQRGESLSITYSDIEHDKFFIEKSNSPWRAIVTALTREDGHHTITVELIEKRHSFGHAPKRVADTIRLRNPALKTAIFENTHDPEKTKSDLHDFFSKLGKEMERLTS